MISKFRETLKNVARDDSGLALIEFAFILPIMMVMLASGTELANYVRVSTQISQVALQLADNATRIGTEAGDGQYQVAESQVNDILEGANVHASGLNLYGTHKEGGFDVPNGRVIISNVELHTDNEDPEEDTYEITWQRCRGSQNAHVTYAAQYGFAGDAEEYVGGVGPEGRKAAAPDNDTPVIFVEVYYRYQPIFVKDTLIGSYRDINAIAAMMVRDNRNLGNVSGDDDPISGTTNEATCQTV